MSIAKKFNYFLILPVTLSVVSLIAIAVWGLKPGIDLVGGSLLQVSYTDSRPESEQVRKAVSSLGIGEVRVQPTGDKGYLLRQRDLTPTEKEDLMKALSTLSVTSAVHEDQFNSVGPTLGAELLRKALIALMLVTLCIIIFIAFAFRHVSKPVASWKYGVIAVVTIMHDVLIPIGLFAFLGNYRGAEVDTLFIVALLTILGISINDTIVVFDRIRENLALNEKHHKYGVFVEVVWNSIKQTLSRSINTSLTVIFVLASLYFVGPSATKDFSLTLIVGMIAGTYSSIFLASPLLVLWSKKSK